MSEHVQRREDLEWAELDDEIVVYDRLGEHLHRLNAPAATVWRACDGRRFTDIVVSVRTVYDGEPDVIAREVRGIVDEFAGAGLVVLRG